MNMPAYDDGDLVIDYGRHSATLHGQVLKLTAKEYDLLAYLARNAGKPVTYRDALTQVVLHLLGRQHHARFALVGRIVHDVVAMGGAPGDGARRGMAGVDVPSRAAHGVGSHGTGAERGVGADRLTDTPDPLDPLGLL